LATVTSSGRNSSSDSELFALWNTFVDGSAAAPHLFAADGGGGGGFGACRLMLLGHSGGLLLQTEV
jgi:hypothetical protein